MPRRAPATVSARAIVALVAAGLVATTVGTLVWAETLHARANHRRLGSASRRGGLDVVLVLGFGNRGDRANAINRYRVRAALRTLDPAATETRLVMSGGAVAGPRTEARLMAEYARDVLGYAGPITLEESSSTTAQNVAFSIPLLEDADAIAIVSNSVHAEKARAELWRLRPDLAVRLRRGGEHRIGEVPHLKIVGAFRGLATMRRLRELSARDGSAPLPRRPRPR